MVGSFGEVVVMDWGIGEPATPRYRAPEQAAGVASRPVRLPTYIRVQVLRSLLPSPAPCHLEQSFKKQWDRTRRNAIRMPFH